ncbi:MAG: polymerase sigma-54 factor 1 [Pseudomonadota bacterium]|jgi:RNA polymerase sigma-54 factor
MLTPAHHVELRLQQAHRLTPSQILLSELLEVPEDRVMDAVEDLVRANPALATVLDVSETQATAWQHAKPFLDDDRPAVGAEDAAESTLVETLLEQLRLERTTDAEFEAAFQILGHLDGRGFLEVDLTEIATRAGVDLDDAESAQRIVQMLDPTGCGSRNVKEYLLFTIEQQWPDDPWFPDIVRDHLDALVRKRFDKIADALDMEVEDVEEYARMLAEEVDPTPARGLATTTVDYVRPTMTVGRDREGVWRVTMHDEARIGVKLDPSFLASLDTMKPGPERAEAERQVAEAREVLAQLEQRHSLVKQVAELAVYAQRDALDAGAAWSDHVKTLTMEGIAKLVRRNAATISRAVTGRYFRWEHGVVALRDLFRHRHVDEHHTVPQLRAAIRTLIAGEDARRPMSDARLFDALTRAGVLTSRRAVQKHREALGIASSFDRKKR